MVPSCGSSHHNMQTKATRACLCFLSLKSSKAEHCSSEMLKTSYHRSIYKYLSLERQAGLHRQTDQVAHFLTLTIKQPGHLIAEGFFFKKSTHLCLDCVHRRGVPNSSEAIVRNSNEKKLSRKSLVIDLNKCAHKTKIK